MRRRRPVQSLRKRKPVPARPPPPPRFQAPQFLAWNENPHFAQVALSWFQKFGIRNAVETGTYMGHTCAWLADNLPGQVHSVELMPELFKAAQERFKDNQRVKLWQGNSKDVMPQLLSQLAEVSLSPLFVLLDAHAGNCYWPILDELRAIGESKFRNNCLIVIDDFQVPGHPEFGFDEYNGQALNFQFVEKELRAALPDLAFEYYGPPENIGIRRGKLVAFPARWLDLPPLA